MSETPKAESGADLITAERRRQIEREGWSPEHDDEHDSCEMAMAAVAYAFEAVDQANGICEDPWAGPPDRWWPWWVSDGQHAPVPSGFKPSDDPIRNLVKAGALIAAEIDRLQRAQADTPEALR